MLTICDMDRNPEVNLGLYPSAELSILVTLSKEGMDVYNTCMFHEEIIIKGSFLEEFNKNYSEYVIHGGQGCSTLTRSNLVNKILGKKLKLYGTMPVILEKRELLSDFPLPSILPDEQCFPEALKNGMKEKGVSVVAKSLLA